MPPILTLAPCDDDDSRAARESYRATLRRDERWPVCPIRAAIWDYGLIALGVICTLISITVQYG